MRRTILVFGFLFAAMLSASAEELVLKDGTKIQGRMLAVKGDKIEVQTAYGKMQVRRSDILAINFPENGGTAVSESSGDPRKAMPVDESLTGTEYVNRTAHFTLTVPIEWKINPELRVSTDTLAAFSSRDNMRFVIVEHETFAGSLESYKGLVEIASRRNVTDFEKLSESNVTIDGRPGMLLVFRGTNPQAQNLPIEFVAAIANFGGEYLHAVAWCVEPLFNEAQRTLESILLSYHRIGESPSAPPATAAQGLKPLSSTNRVAIDSYVQLEKTVEGAEPVYPALARQTRVQGTVRLHAIIGTDGRVEELEVISGHALLIKSALDAVRKWRYAPTMLNGRPVEVDTTIDVIFSLREDPSSSISSMSPALDTQPQEALWEVRFAL